MLKTITLDRKSGQVIKIKTEESDVKIDYSGLIKYLAEKYLKQAQ